jgi:hypothetical protein
MKVALCISGQPRNAQQTFNYINNNIIKPNNADVFIHMHYDVENKYMEKSHSDNGNCILPENIDKTLIKLYNPKAFLIEKPRNFQRQTVIMDEKRLERAKKMNSHKMWTNQEHKEYALKQILSMYYSIYKCNELKELFSLENNITYDYVIRLRFDLMPLEPILCNKLNPNCLYYIEMGQPDEMISDWMNIGSNAIMNIYSSQFLNIDYMNSFIFYKHNDRISREPSDKCGGLSEHLTRDIMHLYHIPKMGLNIKVKL